MATSRAARRRTLKNILIHCHNFAQTGDRSERQGRLGAPYNQPWALLECEELGIINIIKKWAWVNPNDLFFILMNTSLKGQARFPTILLPLIQLFQISIHGTGQSWIKRCHLSLAGQSQQEMEGNFWTCKEQSDQQPAIMHNNTCRLKINEEVDRGVQRRDGVRSVITCSSLE